MVMLTDFNSTAFCRLILVLRNSPQKMEKIFKVLCHICRHSRRGAVLVSTTDAYGELLHVLDTVCYKCS